MFECIACHVFNGYMVLGEGRMERVEREAGVWRESISTVCILMGDSMVLSEGRVVLGLENMEPVERLGVNNVTLCLMIARVLCRGEVHGCGDAIVSDCSVM